MNEKYKNLIPDNLNHSILFSMIRNNHESFYFKDLDSKFILMSEYLANYFGLDTIESGIGKTDFDFFTKQHAQEAFNDEQRIIQTEVPILGKVEQETWTNNQVSYVVSSKYPLYDCDGKLIGTWGHSINIATINQNTYEIKQNKLIEADILSNIIDLDKIDILTQLKNTKAFYETMNLFYQDAMNTLSIPSKEHFLILLDLTDFKSVNKLFGHEFGDKAITYVAQFIEKHIPEHFHVFRYGGDEFAILIKEHSFEEVYAFSTSLMNSLTDPNLNIEGQTLQLNVCMGISRFKESLPFGNIHDIINQTDKRLYAAKKLSTSNIISDNSYRL